MQQWLKFVYILKISWKLVLTFQLVHFHLIMCIAHTTHTHTHHTRARTIFSQMALALADIMHIVWGNNDVCMSMGHPNTRHQCHIVTLNMASIAYQRGATVWETTRKEVNKPENFVSIPGFLLQQTGESNEGRARHTEKEKKEFLKPSTVIHIYSFEHFEQRI